MSTTEIEGACAIHTVITDACHKHHGGPGSSFQEAVNRVRKEYYRCLKGWEDTPGVDYHLALTVDSPRHKEIRARAEEARRKAQIEQIQKLADRLVTRGVDGSTEITNRQKEMEEVQAIIAEELGPQRDEYAEVRAEANGPLRDPVFQAKADEAPEDGELVVEGGRFVKDKWYFWDETWGYAHGPYDLESTAKSKCTEYARSL